MRFGVNYTPRVGWFHHWLDFSADDVARDLDAISQLGVDHIRIFPLWPLVQPNRSLIRSTALADVERVIELAGARGLDVAVDGLQGHLSSFDFVPSWLTSWHRRDLFRDPEVIGSTAAYLEALAGMCGGHSNVFAVTVGNEVNQFTGAVHPEPYAADEGDISIWLDTMLRAIRRAAPDVLALHACYDATWYDDAQPFTPVHAAVMGDATIVHSWVFNGTAQRYGPDSFETASHARYLVELARAFQVDADRPVWMQEVGAPRNVLPEDSVLPFIERTLEQLADAPHLFGITWWCSHDVSRELADFPPLEYDLGLIDVDGRVKPEGRLFQEAIAASRARPAASPPGTDVRLNQVRLNLSDGGRAALAPGGSFFDRYMDVARSEGHPRIVLENAEDE